MCSSGDSAVNVLPWWNEPITESLGIALSMFQIKMDMQQGGDVSILRRIRQKNLLRNFMVFVKNKSNKNNGGWPFKSAGHGKMSNESRIILLTQTNPLPTVATFAYLGVALLLHLLPDFGEKPGWLWCYMC